jgi:hypothetical protein
LRSTGFDGNLIVFLVTCLFGMNWLSMDIMREQSLAMYFNKVPVINYDAVRMFFGFFGQVQGAVAMIMLGLFVLPNCQSELEGVSCVKGDTAPQEVLIIIAATQFGFTVQILTWLLGGDTGHNAVDTITGRHGMWWWQIQRWTLKSIDLVANILERCLTYFDRFVKPVPSHEQFEILVGRCPDAVGVLPMLRARYS